MLDVRRSPRSAYSPAVLFPLHPSWGSPKTSQGSSVRRGCGGECSKGTSTTKLQTPSLPISSLPHSVLWRRSKQWSEWETVCSHPVGATTTCTPTITSGSPLCVLRSLTRTIRQRFFQGLHFKSLGDFSWILKSYTTLCDLSPLHTKPCEEAWPLVMDAHKKGLGHLFPFWRNVLLRQGLYGNGIFGTPPALFGSPSCYAEVTLRPAVSHV